MRLFWLKRLHVYVHVSTAFIFRRGAERDGDDEEEDFEEDDAGEEEYDDGGGEVSLWKRWL